MYSFILCRAVSRLSHTDRPKRYHHRMRNVRVTSQNRCRLEYFVVSLWHFGNHHWYLKMKKRGETSPLAPLLLASACRASVPIESNRTKWTIDYRRKCARLRSLHTQSLSGAYRDYETVRLALLDRCEYLIWIQMVALRGTLQMVRFSSGE